ncbi:MAG TPA: Hsp20/alpha crystallin family protein [Acidimicrobiales bacterium]
MALVRSDPFREADRLFQQLWGTNGGLHSLTMPMDAYRKDDSFLIRLDLPGVSAESIDLTVEDNVLTVRGERPAAPTADGIDPVISERPYGTFARQVLLGTNLDAEHIRAEYERGVLTVVIPVAEHAKPRRIEVASRPEHETLSA